MASNQVSPTKEKLPDAQLKASAEDRKRRGCFDSKILVYDDSIPRNTAMAAFVPIIRGNFSCFEENHD